MPAQFTTTHHVQFSETDMAGVVHFSNYFRWMEEVEHAFFRSLELSIVMTSEAVELGWPRVAASCEYIGPARFEDDITLELRVQRVGDKSLTYEVEFLNKGQRIALGKLTSVCCALGEGGFRAIAIPAEIRGKLEGIGGMSND